MIRINLIQASGREGEPKAETKASAGRRNKQYAVISILICFGLTGLLYTAWNRQISSLQGRIAAAKREAARLAVLEAQNRRYEADLAEIQSHISVIESLEKQRRGPQQLMTALGSTVDHVDGLYLLSVKSQNGKLEMQGQADRTAAIADFIGALLSDRSFDRVDLRRVFEDDRNSRVIFKFDLVCLYTPPVELAASMPPVAPAGGTERPPGRTVR
jgi:Tfp pilus assembly protein PilN